MLAFLRSALGLQQTPPNAVLISLALFVTAFIMAPTLEQAYDNGLAPLLDDEIEASEAFDRSMAPLQRFMLGHVRAKDLELFLDIGPVGALLREKNPPPEQRTRVVDAVRTAIEAFRDGDTLRAPSAAWIVTASRP